MSPPPPLPPHQSYRNPTNFMLFQNCLTFHPKLPIIPKLYQITCVPLKLPQKKKKKKKLITLELH